MAASGSIRRRPRLTGRSATLRLGFLLTPGMTVGLYGGSFNPVHEGHAHVADTARKRLGLQRVLWLVSPQNPLKPTHATADLSQRMAAVRAWTVGPSMVVSDLERRIGSRFTKDTVRWLRRRFPGVRFVWIMGADSLAGFHRWRGWADLARDLPIAVVSRPGVAIRSRLSPLARRFATSRQPSRAGRLLARLEAPAWTYLRGPFHAVSSTALRESQLTARSTHGMLMPFNPAPGASTDP